MRVSGARDSWSVTERNHWRVAMCPDLRVGPSCDKHEKDRSRNMRCLFRYVESKRRVGSISRKNDVKRTSILLQQLLQSFLHVCHPTSATCDRASVVATQSQYTCCCLERTKETKSCPWLWDCNKVGLIEKEKGEVCGSRSGNAIPL